MFAQLVTMVKCAVKVQMGIFVTTELGAIFVHALKRVIMVLTFLEHCGNGLFTVEIHLLGPMAEEINRLGRLHFVDARLFEHFYLSIKHSYTNTQ